MDAALRFCWLASLAASTLLGGCAPLGAPTQDAEGASRFALEPLLRPGSGFLCPALELHFQYWGVGDDIQAEVTSSWQPDGSIFVDLAGSHTISFDDKPTSAGFHCAGWMDPNGTVHPVEVPPLSNAAEANGFKPTVLSFSSGALLMHNNNAVAAKALWWAAGTTSTVAIDVQGLTGAAGVRADKSGPVTITADSTGSGALFQRWRIDETPQLMADGAPLAHTLPAGSVLGFVRFVEELAPGVFAWIQSSNAADALEYFRTDRASQVTTPFSASGMHSISRDPDTGHIVVVDDRVHDWDVDGTGTMLSPALPALAEGHGGWVLARNGTALSERSEPNPQAAQLRIPLSYQLASLEDGAMVARDVPPTPCTDRALCRGVAEHYLLGALGSRGRQYGVYYAWPWLEDSVRPLIVIAPLP